MNNKDALAMLIIEVRHLKALMPTDAKQYADEEMRVIFSIINSADDIVNEYLEHQEKTKVGEGTSSVTRNTHVGSSDYSKNRIQPWDVWIEYGLNPWDADIMKRIIRTKVTAGVSPQTSRIEDYNKIQHICQERIDQINAGDPFYSNLKIPAWVENGNG